MLENFFLIFLYHTIVHDNDVKIKDFIDVTSLIQYHLLIHVSNFDKIHRINKDRKYVCESNTDVFYYFFKDSADFCITFF